MASRTALSRLDSIQALRGVAALQVVAFHAVALWVQRFAPPGRHGWPNGAAGVDLFFVISGFVMTVSASRLPAGAWWPFLRRRLVRVVPLYWAATLTKAVCVLAWPGAASRTVLGAGALVASLLFFPVRDAAGHFAPVLPVGWTLSFEMLFYGLYALALGQRVPPLLLVAPSLAVLAVLPGGGSAFGLLCDPIVLEFVFGVMIGLLWLRGWRLSPCVAYAACALGAAGLVLLPSGGFPIRPLAWGLAAACLVAGAAALEGSAAPRIPAVLRRLGDASYAIYLSHGFVLACLPFALGSLRPWTCPLWLALLLGLPASAAAGLVVHVLVEWPLLAAFSARSTPMPVADPRCAA